MGNIRHRANRSFNLTTFTDELHNSVGTAAFVLSELLDNDPDGNQGHDYFTQEDLVIRTASGGGGVLLVENTDYILTTQNDYLTEKATEYAGSTKTIFKKIQVTNASYQGIDLYFSGKYLGDDLDSVDINNITNYVKTLTSDTTISDGVGYTTYLVETTDTLKTTVTLPDATKNKNLILKILKSSNTYAPVVIDTYSAQTVNGWNYTLSDGNTYQKVPIFNTGECVEIVSDGANWIVINNYTPVFDSGLLYDSRNHFNARFGGIKIVGSSATGKPELYEVVQGATNGIKGIVIDIDDSSYPTTLSYWIIQTRPINETTGASNPFSGENINNMSSGGYMTYSSTSYDEYIIYPFIAQNGYYVKGSTSEYRKQPNIKISVAGADSVGYGKIANVTHQIMQSSDGGNDTGIIAQWSNYLIQNAYKIRFYTGQQGVMIWDGVSTDPLVEPSAILYRWVISG